jgi:hypothetical protein
MEKSPSGFHVRPHDDGTFDSICPKCFLIVARELLWDELEAAEQRRECEILRLQFMSVTRQQMQQEF